MANAVLLVGRLPLLISNAAPLSRRELGPEQALLCSGFCSNKKQDAGAAFIHISETAFIRISETAFIHIPEIAFIHISETAFIHISETAFHHATFE
jgi:hypothetical protein